MTPDPDTLFPADPPDPTKAYSDTSGWSGSDTSRERAERDDASGRTHERDDATLAALMDAGDDGLTWFELGALHDLHHGEASASLSRLHRLGRVARLTARRGRSQIYVTLGNVAGRPVERYRPNVSRRAVLELLDNIEERLAVGDVRVARRIIHFAKERYGKGIVEP